MRKKFFSMWVLMLLLMVTAAWVPGVAMANNTSASGDSVAILNMLGMPEVALLVSCGLPVGNQESGIIGGGPVLGIGTKPESVSVLNQALSFDLVLALVANCNCHRSVAGHTDNIARKYLPDIV